MKYRNPAFYRHKRSARIQADSCQSDNKYKILNIPLSSTLVVKERKEKGGSAPTTGLSGPGVTFLSVYGVTLKTRGARQKIGRFAKILNDSGGRMSATKTKTRGNKGTGSNE